MFGLIPFNTNSIDNKGDGFGNLLSDFFDDNFFTPFYKEANAFKADIKETENEYLVEAELPGVKKEDISLEYKDNNLTISAKRDETIDEEKDNYVRKERHHGTFSRTFYVEDIKEDSISAKFDNGELIVTLPKLPKTEEKVNKIDIQ
ncbi:Hsp20/alpha crystallin family protein [Clostridium bornimense]|uniref:Hsp20/alpha crystallin family protein n=2 Tax=Clostridium bornimense TaxID=1216932 RepID=UPI001C1157B4|nr:Hsp20/alpha crystallin family protein [Clostridium bornimense]MBU5317911.1 Hsp20/alpha crystallin family protein [Clostridium bornimense]